MGIDVTLRREPTDDGSLVVFSFLPRIICLLNLKKTGSGGNNRRVLINELFGTIHSSLLLFSAPIGERKKKKLLNPFECLIPFE